LHAHFPAFSLDVFPSTQSARKQERTSAPITSTTTTDQATNEYGQEPMLGPDPGNDTRWDSREDEARRATIIMHDFCKANFLLLSVGGDDHNLFTDKEKKSGDIDRLAYTAEEIMALRQFEASSMEAKYFSKFTQERGNTSAYLLLEIQTVLLRCGSDIFPMHEGMFSSNL
jgi:hypothetical protein